jgi:ABC-type uncharacterized transport system permease subunit
VVVTATFLLAAIAYAVACALFLVLAARGGDALAKNALRALGVGVVLHLTYAGADFALDGRAPIADIRTTLALASLLISVGYLGAMARKARLVVLGAFIAPVSLLLFLGAGLGRGVSHVPAEVRSALLPVHVGVNVLGIVAFALATATSIAYLVQERALRRKQLGGLFRRLPPLDQLDRLGLRLVTVGFPLLTVGIVSGALFAVRTGEQPLDAARVFALVAWLCFAAVLILRVSAGWRGRRAAIGTMVGFACAVLVLLGYAIRDAGGAS